MKHDHVLLVGSVPLETAENVFDMFGGPLGEHLCSMPDGEVGPRSHWISRLHYQVLAIHPGLEVVRQPTLEDGVERLNPRDAGDSWQFRVRDGTGPIRFGDSGWRLGFAREALSSYYVFRTMREAGRLAPHLRFQVSLPSVNSALPPRIFPVAGEVERVREGFMEALKAELQTIVQRIPPEDLAVQWDCATEVQDAYGSLPGLPAEGRIERNLEQFRALSPLVPEAALLGFHLCFGTLGGWPRFVPESLDAVVDFANAVIAASGRRVDWAHIPVLDRDDEAFYAPLAKLKPQGARVYLGAIHHMDGFERRIATARRFLAEFGVAAYCGFGRIPPAGLVDILHDHQRALELVSG